MGAALADPSAVPDGHLVMTLVALAEAFPGTLKRSDVLTLLGEATIAAAWNTQPVHHLSDTIARQFRFKGPVLALDRETLPAWTAAMTEASAGRVLPRCAVHVMVDERDGGSVIPVGWQDGYVGAVEALGGDVTVTRYPDDDHFSLPLSCVATAQKWLAERFEA